jgi:23S rRNA pseudouridine955/2504/2580 synthase
MLTATVSNEDNNIRLDRFFKRHYHDIPFTVIAKLMRKGKIKVNGKKANVSRRLIEGEILSFPELIVQENPVIEKRIPKEAIEEIKKAILYIDDDIIAINKPAGLAVQGGSKIKYSLDDLCEYLKFDTDQKPRLVHRLDKETSGVIILARNVNTASNLGELFKLKRISKTYFAIVKGMPNPLKGKIDIPLNKEWSSGMERMQPNDAGKDAITHYEVIDHSRGEFSLVTLKISTGRTHQIRAHLSILGCPILFDKKYGNEQTKLETLQEQLYLHACEIALKYNNKDYKIIAPLPEYFNEALKILSLSAKS